MDIHTSNSNQNGNGKTDLTVRANGSRSPGSFAVNNLFDARPSAMPQGDPALSLHTMLRWKWTILGVFSAISMLLLVAIWTTLEPQYGSTTVVRVASSVPRVLYKTEDNGTVPLFNSYINTQVSVIQSPEVLSRVMNREEVRATEWFQSASNSSADMNRMVDKLARQLVVTLRRGTELIDVFIETRVPADAATIVNAVAEEYKSYWNHVQADSERQRVAALRDQLSSVKRNINELFERKFALAEQMGTATHPEVRSQMLNELSNKKAALALLIQERKLRDMEGAHRSGGPGQPAPFELDVLDDIRLDRVPPEIQTDPSWMRHQEEYVEARKRLDLARRQFGESHPALQSAMADVDQARRMLRLTEQRLGLEPYAHSNNPEIVEKRHSDLEASIAELQARLISTESLAQEVAKTEELYAEQKLMRKDLMDRLNALETESNAPARISIQSEGLVRLQASTDRRLMMSACSLVFAALGALGIGYMRGRTDPKIHEISDIGQGVPHDVPFLGQLPRARDALHVSEDTLLGQAINENVRIIRTMMLQRLGGKGGAVVITSPEASSGKTTVAILLGKSLAAMGKRVLLVDVDMLHPSVSQHFEAINGPGLRGVLTGSSNDETAIVSTDVDGLDVLPIGRRNGARDNDVLAQGSFAAGIQRWKSKYDVVLLDSPPVLSMADTRITAAHSDGAIMVLRSSGSNREDAVEAFAGLSAAGARLLGTLLVGVSQGSAYYPYYYRARHQQAAEMLA
ncbi:MAG: AAA family ATPase [Planctomycetes bacterium]|nr:AAA family ATPase [Planctomycetota bacterium]